MRVFTLFAVITLLPLTAAAKCQSVAAPAPAAALPGGGQIYTGAHPPLSQTGTWTRTAHLTWHFIAYTALAAAIARAATSLHPHITLAAPVPDSPPPAAQEVTLTLHAEPDDTYQKACFPQHNDFFLLAAWKLKNSGKQIFLDCLFWKKSGPPKFSVMIDCLTRIITTIAPVTRYEAFSAQKIDIWEFGRNGEMITLVNGSVHGINMSMSGSWSACATGKPFL